MSITIENIDDLSFEHIYETEDRDEVLQFVKTSEIDEFFVQQEDDTYYRHRNSDIEEYRDVVKVPGKHFGAFLTDNKVNGREFVLSTWEEFNQIVSHNFDKYNSYYRYDETVECLKREEYTAHNYKNVKIIVTTRKLEDQQGKSDQEDTVYKFYDVTID